MPRREKEIDPTGGPVAEFAAELRRLRWRAGSPPYRELAVRANYAATTLSKAASGERLANWSVVRAFVAACGEDPGAWRTRYEAARAAAGDGEAAGAPGPVVERGDRLTGGLRETIAQPYRVSRDAVAESRVLARWRRAVGRLRGRRVDRAEREDRQGPWFTAVLNEADQAPGGYLLWLRLDSDEPVSELAVELAGDGVEARFAIPAEGNRRAWTLTPTVRRSLVLRPGDSAMWPVHLAGGARGTVALQVTCTVRGERWDSVHTLGVPARPVGRLPAPRPPSDALGPARVTDRASDA